MSYVKRGDIIHVFGDRGGEVLGIVKKIKRPRNKKHSVIVSIQE